MSNTDATIPAPQFIRPNFDRIPLELKPLSNWVLWAAVWNGKKWTKRPIQISGHGASTTNRKHWLSFEAAKQAYECAVARGYMELRERGKPVQQVPVGGIGFVFDGQPDADGLVFAGVDFDKVISGGELASLAQERIKRLGSYTEQSVSGGGLHVIVKARSLERGVAHDGVEMYTSGRYFTMTGQTLESPVQVLPAPFPFAALAVELQMHAGYNKQREDGAASINRQQSHFNAADGERLRKLFGDPSNSLSSGIETNIEEIRSAVAAIPASAISHERDWTTFARDAALCSERYRRSWPQRYRGRKLGAVAS